MPNFYYLSRFSGHFLIPTTHYTAQPKNRLIVQLGLIVLFLAVLSPGYAQNTKGDQPARQTRETRFATKQKKAKKEKPGKRISPKGKSQANSASKGPGRGEAWTGDITGRKIPATRSSKTIRAKNIHPQQAPRTYGSVGDDGQRRLGSTPPKRITPRTASGRARNVYPQKGPYVKKTYPPQSDDSQKFKTGTKTIQPKIRSATGRTKNVFPQRGPYVKKTTPPQRGDTQNFKTGRQTPQQKVRSASGSVRNVFPQRGPYVKKSPGPTRSDAPMKWGRKASTPNKVRSASGFQMGKRITPSTVRSVSGTKKNVFPQRGPYVRGTLQPRPTEGPPGTKKKRGTPLSASKPFIRNKSINAYAGFWAQKPKPGDQAYIGDIAGKPLRRRNFETPKTQGVIPSLSPYMRFKGRKSGDTHYTGKAAGSHISATRAGKAWEGDISGRKLRTRNYSSKAKAEAVGQPLGKLPYTGDKGVGGIVGRFKMTSVTGISRQGAGFTGNIKARKPEKGGGSVSGQLWNNNEKPIAGRSPKGSTLEMGAYQGSLKARKKEAGTEVDQFPGKYRMFDLHPSMRKQGADFTGHIKVRKLKNDYVRNSYASKEALLKMRPAKPTYMVDGVHVRVKQQHYDKRKHAPGSGMPGITPSKETVRAGAYARGMKQYKYMYNPSSARAALKVHDPGKKQGEMTSYSSGVRQTWKYVRNPSASDNALKIRDHRQAMARVTDYQGNIKMKKHDLFNRKGLHPDAQFVKTNKNNVKEERGVVTNLKLFWARLFKKSETQPNHLKEKIRSPRYDKSEIGLWSN